MHLAFFYTRILISRLREEEFGYGNIGCRLAKYKMLYSRTGGPLWDMECIAKLRWQVQTTTLSSNEV